MGLIAVRILSRIYALMPLSVRTLLGGLLGDCLRFSGWKRNVVEENLKLAYPSVADEAKRSRLKSAGYRHFGRLTLEILLLLSRRGNSLREFIEDDVQISGLEHWRQATENGKGAIFVSSHVGNWEVMAARGGLSGIDLMIVTKRLKPEWLHQAIEEGRRKSGVLGTYEPKTFRDLLGHLKKGGTVGFVLDQYTGPPVGIRVPVFGVPVGTHSVLAVVAKRTGACVLPVINYRLPDGRFKVEIQPPLSWIPDPDVGQELGLNTAAYASVLESHIRAHPEQWLWIHRRFKGDLGPLKEGEWRGGRTRR